jgi:hypothetical protein
VEVRGGGEWRAWCGEAEMGAPFRGSQWRVEVTGREDGDGRWCAINSLVT